MKPGPLDSRTRAPATSQPGAAAPTPRPGKQFDPRCATLLCIELTEPNHNGSLQIECRCALDDCLCAGCGCEKADGQVAVKKCCS